ncbi:hypothetical protein N665_0124s0093 [Sinapis alba]|nr:hypothetical protein N665_0124s0093 [Sinapis alba]
MEGDSSWKPNKQGGGSLANDWRSQHEPDLRKKVILAIVEKLKTCFPRQITNNINKTACTFENKIYGMAKDKSDYLRKIHEKILAFHRKFRSGTSANGANTPDPAQALNQGQSLPTSLTYANTPTSQQCLPQNNIQSNLNIPDSSGLPTQAPITVSAAQNLNIQMGEGVVESNLGPGPKRQIQGRQQLLQKPQQQHQMDQQLLREQQHHQQSLLGKPILHQFPHHRSLSPVKQSFPDKSSALSSVPSSSSHPLQMAMSSQEHKQLERKHYISQVMNGQDTKQNHLTSPEKQRTSQQNNTASFNVHGSSLLGTQKVQEVERSTSKTLNTSGGDWREETYQKIKSLREKYILDLTTMFQKLSDKLQKIDSLPQQKMMMPYDPVKKLRAGKAALEQCFVYLNVSRSSVSEMHRDRFSIYEAHILKFTKPQRAKQQQQQQQQVHLPPSQIHQTALQQSLDSDQKNSRLMASHHQNGPSSSVSSGLKTSEREMPHSLQTRPKMEPKDDNNIMSSSGDVVVHSLEQKPQLLQRQQQQTPPTPLDKTESQENPLVTLTPEPIAERPIDRLIKAIQSSSPESLAQSVSEMSSVISLTDRFAGSVHSIGGARARLAEDLSGRTRFRLQRGRDTNPNKRFKRSFTTIPRDITSQTDSYKIKPGYALLQEIIEINRRLVETVVNICNEEDVCPSEVVTSGLTVVTCSYVPVALSATFKALYNSGHITQIQPLRILVPENYPSSPILLEKVLFDTASVHKYEDLSARARSRFGLSIKEHSEPMSLKKIAQVWDECTRATMLEYAERHGGGTFSSKYGRWESVLRAS